MGQPSICSATTQMVGVPIIFYEKSFTLSEQGARAAHQRFLSELAAILPEHVTPLIVTDAGFKAPWFKDVEHHGWFWLSRVRGRVQYADIATENWQPIKDLHTHASSRPKRFDMKRLTRSNPISCQIICYRACSKGRKSQRSTTTNSHHPSSKVYAKSASEPWILATNLPSESRSAKQIVNLYAKRMQIEETFRDLKSPAYGFGLRQSRTHCPKRFDIILMIALMLQCLFWLAGIHALSRGWQRDFQANTVSTRNVLSIVRLGREVLLKSRYEIPLPELLAAATQLRTILGQYGYTLADL